MATHSAEIALVRRFHTLSQNYEQRPVMARRNTLPTLTRFLTSKEREIRKTSLEAVLMLAQHPDNVELLAGDADMVSGVMFIYKDAQYDDPELAEMATKVLDTLSPAFGPTGDPRGPKLAADLAPMVAQDSLDEATASAHSSPPRNPSVETREGLATDADRELTPDVTVEYGSTGTSEMNSVGHSWRASTTPGNGSVNSRLKPGEGLHALVVELPAVTSMAASVDVEDILLRCNGVQSFTINTLTHQAKIYITSKRIERAVQDALASSGFVCIVLSCEQVQNSATSRPTQEPTTSYYDNEQQKPSYVTSAKNFASSLYNAVMVYTNTSSNTLASRVQRYDEVPDDPHDRMADRLAKRFARWW